MEKKEYLKPAITVVELGNEHIMADSFANSFQIDYDSCVDDEDEIG
ncbi:MAG: hypothetical protein ACI4BA_07670 [Prevotella sp.]